MTATTGPLADNRTVSQPHLGGVEAVYLSGPMTGYPQFNYPTFRAAAERLRGMGLVVFNPAEVERPDGLGRVDTSLMNGNEDLDENVFNVRTAFAEYSQFISLDADAVAVLPGWRASVGARAEVALAVAVNVPVLDASSLEVVDAAGFFAGLAGSGSCGRDVSGSSRS